jgi:16S rRNA processing protein RimM
LNASLAGETAGDVAPGHVAVGRVVAASGLRGHVKAEPLAPDAELAQGRSVSVNGREHVIESSRRRGRFIYVKLSGVDTREEAASLRGAYLQVREADLAALPAGQFYRFQLIGLAVRATDGRDLGRITEVISTPENDVFVVQGPLGEVLIPATDDVVRGIDLDERVATVEVIPGLLG